MQQLDATLKRIALYEQAKSNLEHTGKGATDFIIGQLQIMYAEIKSPLCNFVAKELRDK